MTYSRLVLRNRVKRVKRFNRVKSSSVFSAAQHFLLFSSLLSWNTREQKNLNTQGKKKSIKSYWEKKWCKQKSLQCNPKVSQAYWVNYHLPTFPLSWSHSSLHLPVLCSFLVAEPLAYKTIRLQSCFTTILPSLEAILALPGCAWVQYMRKKVGMGLVGRN